MTRRNHDRPDDLTDGDPVRAGVVRRDAQYAVVSGYRALTLDLMLPSATAGPVPVVVSLHGGGWRTGSHKSSRQDAARLAEVWQRLLDGGVAVASVAYRLSSEAPFPAQLHDVKAAVRWLRRYAPELGLLPGRIGAFGESAGGHLAAFLATNVADADLEGELGVTGTDSSVQAVVAWYPPTRLDTMQAETPTDAPIDHDAPGSPESRLVGQPMTTARDRARWASPITHLSASSAPLLVIHGEQDVVVPPEQGAAFVRRAAELGVPAELVTVPGADHVFRGVTDRTPILERTTDFLVTALTA